MIPHGRADEARRPTVPTGRARSRLGIVVMLAAVAGLLAGCSSPILANPPASLGRGPAPSVGPSRPPDPQPIRFPGDDGPHDRLTEWWYYTGHLTDATGARYGFEYVVFRAERGGFPVSWAAHLAVTDETGQAFHYAQRSEVGPQVDRSPAAGEPPGGFSFEVVPSTPQPAGQAVWQMNGRDGHDQLAATLTGDEATTAQAPLGLGFDLTLDATKPPALNGSNGWIDFGPAGGSYYYSRTAMQASGTLELNGRSIAVSGSAWFDHQWGDFIAIGGGWDWFAVNLGDGSDLTLSLVRDRTGAMALAYGTLVGRDGSTRHLAADAFTVRADGHWSSPATGRTYPSGWSIAIASEGLEIELTPSLADQELDTRASTGVVYWEGSQRVRATRRGADLSGEAYVELTGY